MSSTARAVRQPGPRNPTRIDSLAGPCLHLEFVLEVGKTLRDALAIPLMAAGINGATVRVEGLALRSFACVRPSLPNDDQHAAYYSETHRRDDDVALTLCVATVGRRDDEPFVHCHAVWSTEASGIEQGGHLLCDQVVVASPARAIAYGLGNASMQVDFDEETNFNLFHPVAVDMRRPSSARALGCGVLARIRPNEDLCTSIEAACARHDFVSANVRGSIGSIVGAQFEDGRFIEDIATEILVVDGEVFASPSGPECRLEIALIDMSGRVHRGILARGKNPVLICFELLLQARAN